ncbi:MAG TPA: PEGA domain-containing protein [Polyangiaceae bacterium]|nr:PEGA domain-containing protein [Polyangiaceae bacterium]
MILLSSFLLRPVRRATVYSVCGALALTAPALTAPAWAQPARAARPSQSSPVPSSEGDRSVSPASSAGGAPAAVSSKEGPTPAAVSGQAAPSDPDVAARREHAKLHYTQGVEAYRQGQYQAAVDHLLEASKLIQSPALSYNIAVSYAAMQDERAALRWFRNYLRESPQAPDAASVAQRIEHLERALQGKGVQQVTFISDPPGATLELDERPIGVAPFTLEIVPGNHRIRALLRGYSAEESVFELRPDRARDVRLELKPEPSVLAANATGAPAAAASNHLDSSAKVAQPPAVPEPSRPAAASTRVKPSPARWLGIASVGVGGAALGAALAFELMRRSAEDDAREASQAAYQDRYDTMNSRKTTARVFLGAGSAFLVGGLAALIVDWKMTQRRSVGVATCGLQGWCPVAQGAF